MNERIILPKLQPYLEGEYHAFNSGGVEQEVGELLYGMVKILKPNIILETGTHKGISAAYMGIALKENEKGLLYTIEFDSQHWKDAKNLWNIIGVENNIIQDERNIDDIMKQPQYEMYDMLFLDSEPNRRWNELIYFYPYLNPGGYIFLHDLPRGFCKGNINPDHPDFKDWPWGEIPKQIKSWLKNGDLKEFHLPNPREMCGFYKKHPGDYVI